MKQVIFILILILIAVIFLSRVGLFNGISFSKNFFSTKLPSPTQFTVGGGTSGASQDNPLPKGFTSKNLSPFYKRIHFSSVVPANAGDGIDTFVIAADIASGESADVTGWFLRGNQGGVLIPGAIQLYNPAVIPIQGHIALKAGQVLSLYSSASPIGLNMRLNKCSGYLSNRYSFAPALPDACATPPREEFATLSGTCQDYILSLNTCEPASTNPPVADNDVACRRYLNSIDYPGCVASRRNDADFYLNEWRVWLGQSFLDPLHDRVLLLDKGGNLVDQFIY